MKLLCRFFYNEMAGGVILIMAAASAIILTNLSATKELYYAFLNTPIELRIGSLDINKNILLWINDALMAVFFLLVGLEIKRELIQGTLATCQRAALPTIAAIGGMIVPALIYLSFNYQDPVGRMGWAIPSATDIAFALAVLALLGKHVPIALKIFLMALAIIDDLGAIIIVALFYTHEISISSLCTAAGVVIVLALLNAYDVRRIGIYILMGISLWTAVLQSGLHATLAGVIVGFLIPLKEQNGTSPAKQLVYILHPWVEFMVLPLFAFVNAGISLQSNILDGLSSTIPLSIIIGLVIGKPLGISLFCWISLKLKFASLPIGTTFKQIMAIGMLCGIGFTMSIFIASLAFETINPQLTVLAKLGILIGSLLAAFIAHSLLRVQLLKQKQTII